MDETKTIVVYTDYKSPYAYLAKDLIYGLEDEFHVRLDWLPYTLDIPSYLGSARLDDRGDVIESERSPHQWRRVRYSYMDCRRQARKRGLVILGTRKIWDSSIAAIGMLWAKRQGPAVFRAYHDRVFEHFWRRELDIEDAGVITGVLAEAGAATTGFCRRAGAGKATRIANRPSMRVPRCALCHRRPSRPAAAGTRLDRNSRSRSPGADMPPTHLSPRNHHGAAEAKPPDVGGVSGALDLLA